MSVAVRPSGPRLSGLAPKLLLLVIALGFAAVLGEVMVRVAIPGFPGFRIPQVEHRPVPGIGYEMVPSQVAYTRGAAARINKVGFRGSELMNPPGTPRVLCLGDSFTFGVGVEDSETFASQLQRLLESGWPDAHPEVVNMGVQRYFTYQEIEQLKKHVGSLRPDVVSLTVYVNDLGVRPSADFVREYDKEREQAATAFRNTFPRLYNFIKNIATIELLKSVYLSSTAAERTSENALAGIVTPRDELKWQGVEREFVTFRELSETYKFQPLIVFVPARPQINADLPSSLYPKRLVEHARSLGLATIDPIEAFKVEVRAGRDPYLAWDDHLSANGHRLMAQAVAEYIGTNPPPSMGAGLRAAQQPQ